MTTFEIALLISIAAAIILPFVVFLCVKLGTYAYYKGRQIFQDELDKEKKDE